MLPPAGAGAGVFCAVKDHMFPPFKKAGGGTRRRLHLSILAVTVSYVQGKSNAYCVTGLL